MRLTGSKEEAVEVEPREAGWSIVATAISPGRVRWDFDRSFALETRLGTSERSEELIYPLYGRQRARNAWMSAQVDSGVVLYCDVGCVSERAAGYLGSVMNNPALPESRVAGLEM